MLFGREGEAQLLAAMIRDAGGGVSGALVIHGEAGIGKTALLDQLADDPGVGRVLRTTGIESEAELPFAALHRLLRPALGRLDLLPEPQGAALRAAFGLVAPTAQDRLLIGLAVLTLLSEYAGEDPVLCLVDDAQWVDHASLDALAFAARRLDAEGVVMLFAQREPAELGLPMLRLEGLDSEATRELLAARAGVGLPAYVLDHVVEQARGNPLALIELPGAMTDDQRAGLLGPAPPTPSARVQAVFRRQIEALPEPTRAVLLVAAADDTGEPGVVLTAAGATVADLEPAEKAGLIEWTAGALAFRHPLVRTAAYHAASLAERIAAHASLAAALPGAEHADRRAWHRAAAAVGPDEDAAAELDHAAERAVGRTAVVAAATAYERAAQLSVDPEARRRRMVAAAQAAADAGQFPRVATLLARVEDSGSSELARARAALELNSGSAAKAVEILLGHVGGPLAIVVEACHAGLSAGDSDLLARVCESASGRHAVLTALATLVSGPGPADLSVFEPTAHDESALFSLRFLAAYAALASGEHRVAHEAVVSLLAYCRSRGLHAWQASCLHLLAETHLAHGRLEPARQTAEEGLRIAEYGAHEHRACHLRATLAVLAALRGDGGACRRLAGSALTWATDHRIGTAAARAHHALALLQLGSTDPQNAYTQLVQIPAGVAVLTAALLPDLIEAGTRIGAPTGDAAQRYQQWATTTARPLTAALAARCRALTATEAAVEEHFGEALRSHGQADAPFDEARTRLLYGEWLRRQRRRTDARRQLRAAVETFARLRAEPWAERARTELRGTGEVADRSRETGTVLDRLTPQEREVVRLAAAGATNRDIAAQLFLSPRTVGHHLYRAFPKLGIASRSQLGELLG